MNSKRICPIHGIWSKTDDQTRCPKCARKTNKEYDKKDRNKESAKFYHSVEWKKVRNIKLKNDPLCVVCGRPARIVDHIIEIRDGGCKLCMENLQSMCMEHHNQKTSDAKAKREGANKSLQVFSTNTDANHRFSQSPFYEGGV